MLPSEATYLCRWQKCP